MFLMIKLILICIVYPLVCLNGSILGPPLFITYINDLCNASKLFKMIIYAGDTTLYSTLDVFDNYNSKNLELTNVADWLKLNKLSINIKKTKFMVFHMPQKQVNIPNIEIENIKMEFADEFNFFVLTIHKHKKIQIHGISYASKTSEYTKYRDWKYQNGICWWI